MNLSARETFLGSLEDFIASAENSVEGVLSTLGWTADHVLLKDDCAYAQCPLDPAHRVPCKSLSRHVSTCSWIKDGFSYEELERLPPSSHFAYEQSASVVTVPIDESTQEFILQSVDHQEYGGDEAKLERGHRRKIPKTGDRASVDFSRQERLAVYDFVVAQSKAMLKDSGVNLEDMYLSLDKHDEPQKPKSRLELLAEERDYKRRRQSYRAKNVHITKKSYTEVIRDVIEKQMDYLNPEPDVNSPSLSEGTDGPSCVTKDGFVARRETSSKDVIRNSGDKHDRMPSLSCERRRSHYSTTGRAKKERGRSRSPKSRRRDLSEDSSSSHHSRSHKKHKHKHGHHRSRHRRSTSRN